MRSLILSFLLFSAILFTPIRCDNDENECVYTFYVETGTGFKAGTDSRISVSIGDAAGRSVWIPNLESWGLMGPTHDYFERGNVDIFSGRAPCIGAPICRLNLTSDGSGAHHGWYCDYLEVTSTGAHKQCRQTIFYVEQWLATDVSPYRLTAMLDGCRKWPADEDGKLGVSGKFIVGNPSPVNVQLTASA
ncbi:PLAT domain-containing protein 2 [Linum grandiflorum]